MNLLKPTIQMAFACENISTDPAGRISFQNVIDSLAANSFPATTGQFFAIFGFLSQLAGFLIKPSVEIADENGKTIVQGNLQDMAFTPGVPIARAILGFPGITWPYAGKYLVKFTANNVVQASFPIIVQDSSPQPRALGASS